MLGRSCKQDGATWGSLLGKYSTLLAQHCSSNEWCPSQTRSLRSGVAVHTNPFASCLVLMFKQSQTNRLNGCMDRTLLTIPISSESAVQSLTCSLNLNVSWLMLALLRFHLPGESHLYDQEMRPVNQSSAATFLHALVRLQMKWVERRGVLTCFFGCFFLVPFCNYTSSSFLLVPPLRDRSSLKCCPRCIHMLNFPRWGRSARCRTHWCWWQLKVGAALLCERLIKHLPDLKNIFFLVVIFLVGE